MTLIDSFMPRSSFRQVDCARVHAAPDFAWSLVRRLDVALFPPVRRLLDSGHAPSLARPTSATPASFEGLAARYPGLLLLGERGRELVVGAVVRLWKPSLEHARVTKEGFETFAEPGFVKIAWSLSVEPRANGESWVISELRLSTTDKRLPERLFGLFEGVGRLLQRSSLDALTRRLGAGRSEEDAPLPGDEFLAATRFQKTHAITIEAPPERVWPWLVQMGAHRGGWYSFDLLDNAGITSATRIIPELQRLEVGDRIPTLPGSTQSFTVLRVEPARVLVLGSGALLDQTTEPDALFLRSTWSFVLEPVGQVATRLTVRVRGDYLLGRKMLLLGPLMGLVHSIMESRQLQNLRRRARGDASLVEDARRD